MARFKFVDLREGVAAPSAELADTLEIAAGERLIGRRLRGVGRWDFGRELFEIVVPSRLPAGLDYTADDGLGGLVDHQARGMFYGEAYVDLREKYGAYETVTLHRYVESPVPHPGLDAPPEAWEGYRDREPFGLLVFFRAGRFHQAVSWVWRCAHRLGTRTAMRLPRPASAGPRPADEVAAEVDRVMVDRAVMGGAPCIRGTRIPVLTVLGMLAECPDQDAILADFPQLVPADLRAAVRYAAAALSRPDPEDPATEQARK